MRVDTIEKDYWWEIKAYLEEPTEDAFLRLLKKVYIDAYVEGCVRGSWDD